MMNLSGPMTIYEATESGPAICLIGQNRTYAIGDTAYLFKRQKRGETLPMFALGVPVTYVNGDFIPTATGVRTILKEWHDKDITVVSLPCTE